MFANGWAIVIGSAAIALPVIIHWLTRPRPTRIAVSTLRFIRGAIEQRRSRYRLRNFLILLLRTLAIALMAAAIARPLLHQRSTAATTDAAAVTRVVLLDCSQSMGARDGGIVRFERARPVVSDLLKFDTSLKCGLLLAGASPNPVFETPTTNLNALRDSLENSEVRPERLRLQQTLNVISEMFARSDPGSQLELVIVSDFQRTNWASADFSVLPQQCRIILRSMAADADTANMAVLDFAPVGRVEAGREAEVSLRIANYSDTPRHVRVEVRLGTMVVPFEGHCPSRATTSLGGRVPINSDGWHIGSARLIDVNDALPDDNQLPIALQAHPQPRIAILTRDRPDQIPSVSYYVERAVASTMSRSAAAGNAVAASGATAALPGAGAGVGTGSGAGKSITRMDAADPDVEQLRQADVVILARPGRLSSDTITVLTAMLQRGRSLLYVAGDQLDAANLSDLSRALGSAVRLPVEFIPRPLDRSQTARFLTDVDRRRPPFSIFGDELAAAVKSLEFVDGLISRTTSEGLKDDVRATLSDQSAFLTVTSVGRGKLAILNADLERSNIARTPVLVPLLGELMSQELTSSDSKAPSFSCGESLTLQLPIGEERLNDIAILGPDDRQLPETERGTLTAIPAGIVWDMSSRTSTGTYQVQLEGRTVSAAIGTIPDEESDLRALSEDVFSGRLSGGRQLSFLSGSVDSPEQQDDLWVWLAAACVGCLLLELGTLKFFRT